MPQSFKNFAPIRVGLVSGAMDWSQLTKFAGSSRVYCHVVLPQIYFLLRKAKTTGKAGRSFIFCFLRKRNNLEKFPVRKIYICGIT